LSQILLPWQPASLLLKFDWHHLIACPGEPPVRRKRLGDILYNTSYRRLNFVAIATGLVVTEFVWRHSIAHPRIPPTSCKQHYDILHMSGVIACFVSNFVAMTTAIGRGRICLISFDSPTPETPVLRKNLRASFYTSRVITDFVPNFVAVATGVGHGRICLASFNSPSPKTPCSTQRSPGYLLYKSSYSRFYPKFRCHGNGGWSW